MSDTSEAGGTHPRTAVILFNLGGPDDRLSVEPFLRNLFNDRAIINLPQPWRWLLSRLIAARRTRVARRSYARLGGGSPLRENTEEQISCLRGAIDASSEAYGNVFLQAVMRYWDPRSDVVVERLKSFEPTKIVLLPLYPQYSGTTSGSSIADWHRAARAVGLDVPTTTVCCYPRAPEWIDALADFTHACYREAATAGTPRVLFSAHGLPERVIAAGDPYQWQVEATVGAVIERLAIRELDWVLCYQSRVGPARWIGPGTEAEVRRAGAERRPIVVVPVAFVSEHVETLVELDLEYARIARDAGVPLFVRAPTMGTEPRFIAALGRLAEAAMASEGALHPAGGCRICPADRTGCPFHRAAG